MSTAVPSAASNPFSTPLKEGATIPQVVFKTRTRFEAPGGESNPFTWKDLSTNDLFKGKRVVLFSLPGAFTPTCSNTHLPGYEKEYERMTKELGVDDVYCLSVNDAFVMRQWGLSQNLPEDTSPGSLGFKNVKLLPDGAAQFTRGMGLSTVWDKERGFGERSWRYSAVIDDCKIEHINIEPGYEQDFGPDPYEVSDSGTMLEYLESKAKK
jgi:peroxiredoxin